MAARWEDVERVFHEALDRDPAARLKYLAEACGNDPELRNEVESLLSNASAGDVLLDRSGWELPERFRANAADPFAPGATVGSYRITEMLGEGGMGVVYKAADKKLGRFVALKLIRREILKDGQVLARFEREARTLASLSHPRIAGIYGLDEHDGARFLVLEFVPGETLAERLRRGPMPLREALSMAREVAEALEAAHERRIVHRDLKPANVKLMGDGHVKVLDFGLAKAVRNRAAAPTVLAAATVAASLTNAMTIVGTPAYMSPEQASGKDVDTRTDVWAFGCVLFEALAGVPAFRGGSVPEVLAGVLEREPEWGLLPPGTPEETETLVRRCLRKDPHERLRDIGDARIELEEMLSGQRPRLTAPVAEPRSSETLLKYAGWAAALMALAALATVLLPPRSEQPRDPITFAFTAAENETLVRGAAVPSPDGRQMAYVSEDASGKTSLWVRPLHAKIGYRVPQTEGATGPFWSPDGSALGFAAGGKLKKVDLSGGPAQTICNVVSDLGATWGRSGEIIVAPFNRTVLHKVSAAGGALQPITTLDASLQENSHRWPHFLPDGRHFLFTARSSIKENTGIYAGSLDSNRVKRLVTAQSNAVFVPPGYLLFAREGTLVAQRFNAGKLEVAGEPFAIAGNIDHVTASAHASFAAAANRPVITYEEAVESKTQLTWYDRSGQKAVAIGPASGLMVNPRVSPDGRRIAVAKTDPESGNRDIWLVDAATGSSTRFTYNAANDWVPIWSADGTSIYFASDRLGASSIFRRAVDGQGDEELVLSNGKTGVFPSDLSPDGKFLLYHVEDPIKMPDIWVQPLQGQGKPYAWLATDFIEMEATFSPDGKYVAYTSNESGTGEIYVRGFGKSEKHRVSTHGGRHPIWRGNELFFAADDNTIVSARVRLAERVEVESPKPLFRPCAASRTLRGTENFFDVTADRQKILVACALAETRQPTVTVMVDWRPAK